MFKKNLRNTILVLTSGTIGIGTTVPLVSCSESFKVELQEKTINTSSTSFDVVLVTSLPEDTILDIEIKSEKTGQISVITHQVAVIGGQAKVNFSISDEVKETRNFTFTLEVSVQGKPELKSVRTEVISVFYTYEPEPQKDLVQKYVWDVVQINKYCFEFAIQFKYMPQSRVQVELDEKKTQYLSLERWNSQIAPTRRTKKYFDVVEQSNGIKLLKFNVYIDVRFFDVQAVEFDTNLAFVNSSGRPQQSKLEGFTAKFLYQQTDKLLEDFFIINDQNIVQGLKEDIPSEILDLYTSIDIPKGIKGIQSVTQGRTGYVLPNVSKVIFNPELESISKNALANFKHLNFLDFSAIPKDRVMSIDQQAFNPHLYDGGVILLPSSPTSEAMVAWENAFINNPNFNKNWDIYYPKDVVPNEFYITQTVHEQGKEDYTELVGFTSDAQQLAMIESCEVIILPEVDVMAQSALQALKEHPAKHDGQIVNRHLIFSNTLKTIMADGPLGQPGPFENLGICGSAVLTPNFTKLPSNSFKNANLYLNDQRASGDPLKILFNTAANLNAIGDYAFADSDFIEPNLVLPSNITGIGMYAFKNTKPKNIIFNDCQNIKGVGNAAFGEINTLESIDLSCYDEIPDWLKKDSAGVEAAIFPSVGSTTVDHCIVYLNSDQQSQEEDWINALSNTSDTGRGGLTFNDESYVGNWKIVYKA